MACLGFRVCLADAQQLRDVPLKRLCSGALHLWPISVLLAVLHLRRQRRRGRWRRRLLLRHFATQLWYDGGHQLFQGGNFLSLPLELQLPLCLHAGCLCLPLLPLRLTLFQGSYLLLPLRLTLCSELCSNLLMIRCTSRGRQLRRCGEAT